MITRRRLKEFLHKHPNAEPSLKTWYKLTVKADWKNFADLQATFSMADYVAPHVVFDAGGNSYRLIAKVEHKFKKVFIAHVFTHPEYDRWKA